MKKRANLFLALVASFVLATGAGFVFNAREREALWSNLKLQADTQRVQASTQGLHRQALSDASRRISQWGSAAESNDIETFERLGVLEDMVADLQRRTLLDPADLLGHAVRISYEGAGGMGAGVVLDAEHVLTAAHLADEGVELKIEVQTPSGFTSIRATCIKRDLEADLALLKADAPLPDACRPAVLEQDHGRDLKPGVPLYVVGCPKGYSPNTITLGWLASSLPAIDGVPPHLWQCSARVYGGNSGGGVYDAKTNRLVGIMVWIEAPNVSFFVPLYEIEAFLEE